MLYSRTRLKDKCLSWAELSQGGAGGSTWGVLPASGGKLLLDGELHNYHLDLFHFSILFTLVLFVLFCSIFVVVFLGLSDLVSSAPCASIKGEPGFGLFLIKKIALHINY